MHGQQNIKKNYGLFLRI